MELLLLIMKVKKYFFTLFLIILISDYCSGQKNFSEGFIISLNGDTLFGKVNDNCNGLNFKPINIKFIGEDGKEKKYKANSIKGYSKSGIVNYLSIRDLNEGPFFAKILVSGTVSLLASIVQTGASTGKGMDARMFLIHSNKSKTHEVFSMEFKSDLSDYFSDYSELKQQILNKELRYADLEIIVNKYNKWYLKNNYPSENQIIK